jgi:hypothetical protein
LLAQSVPHKTGDAYDNNKGDYDAKYRNSLCTPESCNANAAHLITASSMDLMELLRCTKNVGNVQHLRGHAYTNS